MSIIHIFLDTQQLKNQQKKFRGKGMVNIRLAASAVFLFVGSCLLYNRNEMGDMQRSLREDIGRDEIEKLVKVNKEG